MIAATALMLAAMRRRGFAVATALIKTEPVTLALMGALVLDERLGLQRMGAILVATLGVLALSGTSWRRAGMLPLAIAVSAGALFGLQHGAGLGEADEALGLGVAITLVVLPLRCAPALPTDRIAS